MTLKTLKKEQLALDVEEDDTVSARMRPCHRILTLLMADRCCQGENPEGIRARAKLAETDLCRIHLER